MGETSDYLLGVIASLNVALLLRVFLVEEQLRKANGKLRELCEMDREAGREHRCEEQGEPDGQQ